MTPPTFRAGPTLSLRTLAPRGCQEAVRIIDKFERTAGSTELSQKAAAMEAYQGMTRASTGADEPVFSVMIALSRDFQEMRFILEGMVMGDYAAAQARTNSDAQTLRDMCSESRASE